MDLPAPANGLKLMLAIIAVFAVVAGYGQWQHARRAAVETATVTATPDESPTPSSRRP